MTTKHRMLRLLDAADHHLPAVIPAAPEPFRLQSTQDVLDLLEEQINQVRADRFVGSIAQARAIGRLAGLALKAIEVGQLAARLEMLEKVLKLRNGDAKR